MKELVDRRVRIAERMLYQLSRSMTRRPPQTRAGQAARAVARRLPRAPVRIPVHLVQVQNKVGAANIGPGKVWVKTNDGSRLVYAEGNGTRIRNAAAAAFVPAGHR